MGSALTLFHSHRSRVSLYGDAAPSELTSETVLGCTETRGPCNVGGVVRSVTPTMGGGGSTALGVTPTVGGGAGGVALGVTPRVGGGAGSVALGVMLIVGGGRGAWLGA